MFQRRFPLLFHDFFLDSMELQLTIQDAKVERLLSYFDSKIQLTSSDADLN